MTDLFIGVDVGTGSARAGVFDRDGALLASARRDLAMHRDDAGLVEQSSAQVWDAVCASVREATAGFDAARVRGIGFDATCSLVVMGPEGGLPVSDDAAPERDIIVWMDHRATDQAARINAGAHDVLRYVGGRISPEMQTPKLLWLKEARPATLRRGGAVLRPDRFPDLESQRRARALVLHADLQMDLPGPRGAL